MLTITHNRAEGTLIDGTSRGDGTNDVLKAQGWRWSRNLGSWFVPHSRDRSPKTWIINSTVHALEKAGYTVTTELDDTPRATADVEADKVSRQEDRAQRLAEKATRKADAADAAERRAHELADRVPFGQPILVGHHSEGAMRRHYNQVGRAQENAVMTYRDAKEAERKAAAAAATTGGRYSPVTVGNRIDKLEAEIREAQRRLDGYTRTVFVDRDGRKNVETHDPATGNYREQLLARTSELTDQLNYWQQVRAEQIEAGIANDLGPHNVAKGDRVKVRGSWLPVLRANKKTVTVPSEFGSWTHTVPYRSIQAHRKGPEDTIPVP